MCQPLTTHVLLSRRARYATVTPCRFPPRSGGPKAIGFLRILGISLNEADHLVDALHAGLQTARISDERPCVLTRMTIAVHPRPAA